MEEIGWAFVLAGFAGFVNYLQRFTTEPRPAWDWAAAYVKVVTGAFVGILTLWLIGKRVEDSGLVKFAVAIAGYGGPLTLDFFWQSGRDFLASWATRAAQGSKDDAPKN